jgi:membrane peptidoglycan carboxypeptidase
MTVLTNTVPVSPEAGAARGGNWLRPAGIRVGFRVAGWLRSPRLRLALLVVPLLAVTLPLLVAAALVHRVYFDRGGLPALEPFIRFEPPTTGVVRDAQGKALIELARQYRRVVTYDEVPPILRQAILAAEDKNFFSHSGVDYGALPRVVRKTAARSLGEWWNADAGLRLLLPQGGSTLTQQLVRGYFLQDLTRRPDGDALFHDGIGTPRLLSAVLGASATNKLLRKLEEVRLTLWLEEEMRRHYGSQERAKQEIFARYASFIYLGNGRYGFAAGSEYYFGKPLSSYTEEDAGKAALLAAIGKSPRDYAPTPGDPRPLRRRNEILALMARNGSISEALAERCQAEPVRVAARSALKTDAPAAIESVFDELNEHGGGRFGVEDLFQGRISVHSTVDGRVQTIVNEALENGLSLYDSRHPQWKGLIQGSVVVLRNGDAGILAEAGGRPAYQDRQARYSDYNRVTGSLRQPGSVMKPFVYLAAFHQGVGLDTTVPDEPIEVPLGNHRGTKWIANYDNQFKGPIPMRQALAESRNAVAVWIAGDIGIENVIRTARELGIRTPLQPYISTALGASEVRLLELAGAYRAMASGILAEPHVVERVTNTSGEVLYEASHAGRDVRSIGLSPAELSLIQEGLRGVIRLPDGTAHALDSRIFPIPVMGKTGTTTDLRDALFVGSTYGERGITVAVRIGFDDNHALGEKETGALAALPIFREIMLRIYQDQLAGPVPQFPREIEGGIDEYLATQALLEAEPVEPPLQSPPSLQDGVYVLPRVGLLVAVSDALPAGTSKVYGNSDLQRYVAERPPEAPDASASERQAATSWPFAGPCDGASESSDDAKRCAVLKSHLTTAETYLQQSEARWKSAEEHWQFVTSHANQSLALDEPRRTLERTKKALERAKGYREEAEIAARRAGVPPGWFNR